MPSKAFGSEVPRRTTRVARPLGISMDDGMPSSDDGGVDEFADTLRQRRTTYEGSQSLEDDTSEEGDELEKDVDTESEVGLSTKAKGKRRVVGEKPSAAVKTKRGSKKRGGKKKKSRTRKVASEGDAEVDPSDSSDVDSDLEKEAAGYIGKLKTIVTDNEGLLRGNAIKFKPGPLSKTGVKHMEDLKEILEGVFSVYSRMFQKPMESFPGYLGYKVAIPKESNWNLFQRMFAADPATKARVDGKQIV